MCRYPPFAAVRLCGGASSRPVPSRQTSRRRFWRTPIRRSPRSRHAPREGRSGSPRGMGSTPSPDRMRSSSPVLTWTSCMWLRRIASITSWACWPFPLASMCSSRNRSQSRPGKPKRSRMRPGQLGCSPPRQCGPGTLPQFDVLAQILDRGDLGSVQLATADVGWRMGADAPPRFFDPDQGGGAALDMGVYGYWFAHFAIGRPRESEPLAPARARGSTIRRWRPSKPRTDDSHP